MQRLPGVVVVWLCLHAVQWSPRVANLAPSNTFVPPCGQTQEPRSVNTRLADEGEGEGILLREREGGRIGAAVAASLCLCVDALSHLPVEPQAAANVVRKHRACHRAFRATTLASYGNV